MKKEYNFLAPYYDHLHNEKDYYAESKYFTKILLEAKESYGKKLLDLACGTGEHIKHLKNNFDCEGLDVSQELIDIAKRKNPKIYFHTQDITHLSLSSKYDIITLFFNSIGYLTKGEVIALFKKVYQHLNKGGVFLVETIFLKDKLVNITKHIRKYKDKNSSILRELNISIESKNAIITAKYKINSEHFSLEDTQKVYLFGENELKKVFLDSHFEISVFTYKPTNTTLFLGVKH